MTEEPLPERLIRAARKGRLVVFAGGEAPEGEAAEKLRALPSGLWLATKPWPETRCFTAAEIEEGRLRQTPAGSVVVVESAGSLGTPRRPTRFRDWVEEILRRRTALFVGDRAPWSEFSGRGHFEAPGEALDSFLDRLLEQVCDAKAKAPPPLPAVTSRWGLGALAVAAVAAAAVWIELWLSHGGAQNWGRVRLVPWTLGVLAVWAGIFPWIRNAAAGRQLEAAECYARELARWSRRPKAPAAVALLLLAALAGCWANWRFVPATFLVIYEAAGVTADAREVGACKAEEPCTLIIPRRAHLHFDGAEGNCAMDLDQPGGLILIDLQEDGCEAPDEDEKPAPRGG